MARRRGMVDDRVHASETRRTAAEAQAVHEALARLPASLHLECEQASEVFELPPGELVLGVAWKARIEDASDLLLALEKAGDGQRVRALPLDSQGERLETSPEQEGGERVEHG